jgi:D-glycero-D-manno-heptose 1,7-bisphosphate phosphatase
MPIKTIFLDRDGVINKEVNYLHKIMDCEFIPGIFEACNYFQNIGFKIIIITNQSGIARGFFGESDYQNLTEWIIQQFKLNNVDLLDVFHCPHVADSGCNCRKPKPGMFIAAKKKYNINMKESWAIGDSERDITAASLAGIKNTILFRSSYKIDEENSRAKYYLNSFDDVKNVITF